MSLKAQYLYLKVTDGGILELAQGNVKGQGQSQVLCFRAIFLKAIIPVVVTSTVTYYKLVMSHSVLTNSNASQRKSLLHFWLKRGFKINSMMLVACFWLCTFERDCNSNIMSKID